VGVIFPSEWGTKAHTQSCYILEGESAKLTRVLDFGRDYPQAYIFNGFWDVDPSKLKDPSKLPTNEQPRTGSNGDGFDVRSWGGTRWKDSKDNAFIFTPSGTLKTNNLPNFDGNFHIVVSAGVAYQLASLPTSAMLDGFMMCFADADRDRPNRYFKLTRVSYPCYTIGISPLGDIEVVEEVKDVLEGAVQVQDQIQMSSPAPPPVPAPEPNSDPVIPADGVTIQPAPNPAALPAGVDATVQPGGNLTFRVKATDPNSDALYAAWTATGGALTVSGERQMEWSDADQAWVSQVDWTAPAAAAPGTRYALTYSVSDNHGGVTTASKMAAIAGAGKIAFSSYVDGNYEIYTVDADGTGQARLTNNSGYDSCPSFSPDGTRIAFCRLPGAHWDILTINADGTGETNLTNSTSISEMEPSFSPDGTKIVFTLHLYVDMEPNMEICMMNADGTGQTRVTNNSTAYEDYPCFSPDGTKIAFSSLRNGNWDIFVINTDGSGEINLTNSPQSDIEPCFSPDGTKLAFSSYQNGNWEIYLMNADGTGQTNLTNNTADDDYPCFSPDGTKIAFSSLRDQGWEIYVMNTDGTGQSQLTSCPTAGVHPSWSR
jgi:hypothetical protein